MFPKRQAASIRHLSALKRTCALSQSVHANKILATSFLPPSHPYSLTLKLSEVIIKMVKWVSKKLFVKIQRSHP
jgi:hypothetical protein